MYRRRKGLGDQVSEKVTPDSQKSGFDKASESVTSAGDKVAGSMQPGETRHSRPLSPVAYSTR